MVASITSWLLRLHGPVVYVVVGLLVFFEVAIVIGFFVPGEIASIVGGVIASQHHANVVLMVVVVVTAATVGNIVGYDVGRMLGPWLFTHRPLAGHAGVVRAQELIARRAGPAVVVGRFVVVVRAVLPGLVGMSGMSRRHFNAFSAVGGLVWGTLWVLVGFGLGLSYTKVTRVFGWGSFVVVAALVVAWVVVEVRRRRRPPGRSGAAEHR
ncbi:MAG TPA: VTT domain-containing protein [Acidimicrobiales bacterium]|nr:VTT domain-containing protein [Acidimicrobiales bacterium]